MENRKFNISRFLRGLLAAVILFAASGVASAQEPFKRQLDQVPFIPKGQWITGVSVSYSQSNQNSYSFLIIENISGDTYTFKVSPMLLYCFKDDMAAGGKFGYQRSRTRLDQAQFVLDSENDYTIDGLYNISQNYSAMGVFRNYFSLGKNRRFGFFNEVQLRIGGGESKVVSGRGVDLTGTWSRSWDVNIGLAPGMIMFLNNYSAIEVNVGVLGFTYTHTRMVTDQIYNADLNAKTANFKINLFSISFGAVFYL